MIVPWKSENIYIRHITNSTHSIVLKCLEINGYRKYSPAWLPAACTLYNLSGKCGSNRKSKISTVQIEYFRNKK